MLVKGELGRSRGTDKPQITVEDVVQLDRVRASMVKYVHATISSSSLNDQFLEKLNDIMDQFAPFSEEEHSCELVVHVETQSGYVHVLNLRSKKVVYEPQLLQTLRKDLGIMKMWVSSLAKR